MQILCLLYKELEHPQIWYPWVLEPIPQGYQGMTVVTFESLTQGQLLGKPKPRQLMKPILSRGKLRPREEKVACPGSPNSWLSQGLSLGLQPQPSVPPTRPAVA